MSRSPGITFETATPPVRETLPRMDVAAFVGFAARGPIDVPVPVEDIARFRDIFGPPLELVRTERDESPKTANLGAAVEAFFRNGGRRCWVVRVAQPADGGSAGGPVERTSFGLPGLVSAETGRPSTVRARSYGATYDGLRVGTVLRRRLLPVPMSVDAVDDDSLAAGLRLRWESGRLDSLDEAFVQGDLLRLTMEDEIVAFAPLASRSSNNQNGETPSNGRGRAVQAGPVHFFRRDPVPLRDPVASGVTVTDEGREVAVSVDVQAPSGATGPSFDARIRRLEQEDGLFFRLLVDEGEASVPSDLEDRVVHVEGLGEELVGWLQLGAAVETGAATVTTIAVRDVLWPTDDEGAVSGDLFSSVETVERVRFDLLAWDERELRTRLDRLGFARAHPRAWTALPTDEDLFALQDGESVAPASGTLRADVYDPRFPLARPDAPDDGPFIPLGMADRPDAERTRGRLLSNADRSRLERERLATFSTDVFVDSELEDFPTSRLGNEADQKIYLDQRDATGLHSLWPIPEATLLAVPDAVHRGWDDPQEISPMPASTPYLPEPEVGRDADPPVVHLSWPDDRLGEEDVEVELQEASDPGFKEPIVRYRGPESSVDRYVRSEVSVTLFFRYRIVASGQPGAWSNVRSVHVPTPDFEDCTKRPEVPIVERAGENWLYWSPPEGASDADLTYEVQIDTTPTFDAPSKSKEAAGELPDPPDLPNAERPPDPSAKHWYRVATAGAPAVQYVRIRALRSRGDRTLVGGWSNTGAVIRPLEEATPVISAAEYDDPTSETPGRGRDGLLDVQAAMMRFGAARGDVLSVFALPKQDQPDDAQRHVSRLRAPGAVLEGGEERTLSYGALYYPWLLRSGEASARSVAMPPDGAACGMIAARTLEDGAWMAPANIPLAAVRATDPALGSDERDELRAHNVNAFGGTPRGVLTLGAATLARNPDLEPITTRRLLILIRRLVHLEGPELVFENNTPRLRRRIEDQFDGLLRRLFRRGAFAGATPSEAFRVVADRSVNPPEQVERGRLVVEIRVAPARPLKFLTVRLVQRNGQASVLSETEAPVPA